MKYPVIATQKNDKMVYVFSREKDLKSTNTEILKNQGFGGIRLIDSNGLVYEIKRAYKVRYLGLGGLSLFKKGRQILVDFEFRGTPTPIKLEDFKRDILERINSNKPFWQSSWGNVAELEKRVKSSSTFEHIARLIS